MKIWRSAGQFDPALSAPITWMVTIARNRAIDLVRKQGEGSIEEEPEAMDIAAENPDPLARRELNERLKALFACIGRLEPERQRLVLLAYYNGWSRERLAKELDTPVNTIKTWLRRSLIEIRECLGVMNEEQEALAAEYVLGTLDADERAQAQALVESEPGLCRDRARLGAPARRAAGHGGSGRAAARMSGSGSGRTRSAPRRTRRCGCPTCRARGAASR